MSTINPVDSREFHWDPKQRVLSAELSALSEGGHIPVFCRAYPDACDQGIKVVSHRTGTEAMFVVTEETKDNDNDVQMWTLRPTKQCLKQNPGLAGVAMLVFND